MILKRTVHEKHSNFQIGNQERERMRQRGGVAGAIIIMPEEGCRHVYGPLRLIRLIQSGVTEKLQSGILHQVHGTAGILRHRFFFN